MQSKLEKVMNQNQNLHRQNQLFKKDIEGLENRLIDKEKLISVLILQKNSVITRSEKSENNDEIKNQFNDEDKGFKKFSKPKVLESLNPSVDENEKRKVVENRIESVESDKQESSKK